MTKPSRSRPTAGTPCRGVVEMGGQRLARGKAGDADAADRRLRTARDHDVGVVERDHPRGIADRVRTRRAGRDDRMVRAAEAMAYRHLAGCEIDQVGGDEKWADPTRSALMQRNRGFADAGQAADAGADQYTRPLLPLCGVGHPA